MTHTYMIEEIANDILGHFYEKRWINIEHLDDAKTPLCIALTTYGQSRYDEGVKAERERIVEWCETPLNTHESVRAKTVDDIVAYLSPKEKFVCPRDCGIEQVHTHPGGDTKKVFIRHDLTTQSEDNQ